MPSTPPARWCRDDPRLNGCGRASPDWAPLFARAAKSRPLRVAVLQGRARARVPLHRAAASAQARAGSPSLRTPATGPGGSRTHTPLARKRILSPLRLPFRHGAEEADSTGDTAILEAVKKRDWGRLGVLLAWRMRTWPRSSPTGQTWARKSAKPFAFSRPAADECRAESAHHYLRPRTNTARALRVLVRPPPLVEESHGSSTAAVIRKTSLIAVAP